jgi:hypothetical protein
MRAHSAYRRCLELSFSVPDDVALLGYDDNPLNEYVAPCSVSDCCGMGRTRTGRDLSCPEGSIRAPPDRRAISSLRNAVRAKVSEDDHTGPPTGIPEVVSGLHSSMV